MAYTLFLILLTDLNIIKLMQQIKKLYEKTKQSLICTNKNNPDRGIEIIRQLQLRLKSLRIDYPQLKQQFDSVEVICLNNLACAYNKKGKFKASLYNLQLASQIQAEIFGNIDESTDPKALHQVATTHSNMCAIFSQIGEHEKALKQINRAIQLLLKAQETSRSDALLVFYFNCAVQLEYLNRFHESLKVARKGYSLSATVNQEMESKFVEMIDKIEEKIKNREKKIAKLMMNSIKMRKNQTSVHQEGSAIRHGKSLNLIPPKSIHEELNSDNKYYQSYFSKQARKHRSKGMKKSQYPSVKLPSFYENNSGVSEKKFGLGIKFEQQKHVVTAYSPKNKHRISLRNQRPLNKIRQKSIQKIVLEDLY